MEISYLLIIFFTLSMFSEFTFSLETISPTKSLTNGTFLVSSGKTFELGFFSPGKSGKYYIGIWYKATPNDVVWVANRNNPLNDTSGEFVIGDNGNLVLFDSEKIAVWSSNSSSVAKNPVAQLLDTGNLVLKERESASNETYLWQSFDCPSDNLLQFMKLGWDFRSGLERYLTSWKDFEDPSEGNYTFRLNISGLPQLVMAVGSTRMIRFGPWNGVEMRGFTVGINVIYERVFVFNENEASYYFKPIKNNSVVTRVLINSANETERLMLESGSSKWTQMYTLPYDLCDIYGYCGANSICKANGNPICQCLDGFTPRSQQDWELLKWSDGCIRKTKLDCNGGDGFEPLGGAKLPDLLHFWLNKSMSLEECRAECLKNCSCVAYANSDIRDGGSGCMIWFDEVIDIRELRVEGTQQIMYVKLSASDISSPPPVESTLGSPPPVESTGDYKINKRNNKRGQNIRLSAFISCGLFIFLLLLGCITWKLRQSKGDTEDDIELPLFDLATIKTATNNFSEAKLIGEGGFGRVYKGNLSIGQVAVKRLKKISDQELLEQFKNEVLLIAKLQHKNLVSLSGCCAQGGERMLIYEYMPKKSLDNYIFDKRGTNLSSWQKNFEIIMGIVRGLVYLHHDSKLQIIHRDLKAANVLLDSNMNPKISDFGLARIFEGDEKENQTKNIIGTYGYISPEYAGHGIFSVKFDVFSFGVLLLEIVSGKKNRSFSHRNQIHNLLGHIWLLWNKDEALELMDSCFEGMGVENQVSRCIHIGLLCVQNNPAQRPTMNNVLSMLSNETTPLSHPNIPGFFVETSLNQCDEISPSRNQEFHSLNKMTITLEGR